MSNDQMGGGARWALSLCIAAGLAYCAHCWWRLEHLMDPPARRAKPASVVRELAHPPPSPAAGREGWIYVATPWMVLSPTSEALGEVIRAVARGDRARVSELLRGDGMIAVERGARVKVLETTFLRCRVKVLEGQAAGMTGWLPSEFVRAGGS